MDGRRLESTAGREQSVALVETYGTTELPLVYQRMAALYATFALDKQGRATRLRKRISSFLGFSYDFQDLGLKRVAETTAVK